MIVVILAILGVLIPTIGYVIVSKNRVNNGKFPKSYSHTYRYWKAIDREFYFTSWVSMQIFCMLPGLLATAKSQNHLILGLLTMGYLMIVGLYPSGINSDKTEIHCWAAKLCAISAVIWCCMCGFIIESILSLIVCYVWARIWQKEYETLIMEAAAFLLTYSCIIAMYFLGK